MRTLAIAGLRFYKALISPVLPAACRYVPSCSEYAAEAVVRHGFLQGVVLAGWRLLRCNPFVRGGYDPVPPRSLKETAEKKIAARDRQTIGPLKRDSWRKDR